MDWYKKISIRLGELKDRSEVNRDVVEELVQDICEHNSISYTNPPSSVKKFVIYETLSELALILAGTNAPFTKITVADGVTTDLSKPVDNFIDLSNVWKQVAQKAFEDSDDIVTGSGVIEQTRIISGSIYNNQEEPPMNKPYFDVREGSSLNHIIWDVDDSDIFQKLEVFINGSETAAYSTTSRYDTRYATSEELTEVLIVKTDVYDRTVEELQVF